MTWSYGILESGDHIRVKRTGYYHHGVYIGDNEVIHYTALDEDGITHPEKVKVTRTTLEVFLRGGIVEKAIYSSSEQKNRFNPNEIIRRANSKVGEGGYNFINNNCEDFANFCCYKVKTTTQIDNLRTTIKKIFSK